MNNVFITGISGFVGGYLAKKLIEKGYDVVGLSRDFSTKKTLDMLGIDGKVTLVYGDINDRRVIHRAIAEYRPQHIFHLAGMTIVSTALKIPTETFLVNCVGTANLLEVCKDVGGVRSIVVSCTDKVYGEGMNKKETDALDAVGVYENSKIAMECVVRAFYNNYKLPIVVSRACNIYGAFDTNRRIVPNTIAKLKNNESPIIYSGDESLREYIYVEDVCDAMIMLAENIDRVKGEIFNIGTGDVISQEQMVKKIIEISGKNIQPVYCERDPTIFEIKKQSMNSEKIRRVLGWRPKYTLEQGLRKTWDAEIEAS